MAQVYLIPFRQASQIDSIPHEFKADAWSTALYEGDEDLVEVVPTWATAETLRGLQAIGIKPEIEETKDTLPVFHGASEAIETQGYEEALSCYAYAKRDDDAKGIAYVGHDCEEMLVGTGFDFFSYSLKEGREYIWLIICGLPEAQWLYEIYHKDKNILEWLKAVYRLETIEEEA